MEESEQNFGRNATSFSSNRQVFMKKMIKQFHIETNLPFSSGNDA